MPKVALSDIAAQVDAVFEDDSAAVWEVIILDDDHTTFDEVIKGCVILLGYTEPSAQALAMKVHLLGEAVAATLSKAEASAVVQRLRIGNVRAIMRSLI